MQKTPPRPAADVDDLFIEKTLQVSSWAQRHRQTLVFSGIAAAALIAAGVYYMSYRRGHLERAAIELERVEQGVVFGDTATAKVELGRYIESFGNTPYAGEARLLLGELYLESNQPEQAVQVLVPAAEPSDPLGLQVTLLLAKAREQQGDLDEAEQLLLRVADRADLDFQIRDALEEAARIRRQRGNLAGAVELYRQILEEIEEGAPERGVYEMRLAELEAQVKT